MGGCCHRTRRLVPSEGAAMGGCCHMKDDPMRERSCHFGALYATLVCGKPLRVAVYWCLLVCIIER